VIFSSDGKFLAWADSKRAVIWDVERRRELAGLSGMFSPDDEVWKGGIALSADKRYFAYGRADGEIEVWESETKTKTFVLPQRDGFVLTLAFSADGKLLVSGGLNKGATIWNMETGREVAHLTNFQAWVGAVSFSPNGATLATTGADQTLRLWSTESWQEISTLSGHEFEVWWAAFSPDGRRLVTASKDDTIKVWDASAKAKRDFEYLLPGDLDRLEFSPNRNRFAGLHQSDLQCL
jgi:WD40 repeat protein